MNPIAIIVDNTQIHWDAIIIVMAIPAWFCSFHSLYCANKGKRLASWVFLPFAVLLGAISSRLLYWYAHVEQYKGFSQALEDFNIGCFSMLGILPGLFLAAVLVRCLRLNRNLPAFLDALAPATSMGMGLMYLSCLFNYNCRGKFTVDTPSMQHLPYASPVPEAGELSYRFATFFWSAVFMFILAYICTEFYYVKKKEYGSTACLFLLIFSAGQFILDSTRYDAEYFPFNGFVSILQIFDGVCILVLTIAFSIRAVKRRGFKWYYVLLWLAQAGAMTTTGMMEYMVQRYSDQHLTYYGYMTISCVGMFLTGFILYMLGCRKKAVIRKVAKPEEETLEEVISEELTEAEQEAVDKAVPVKAEKRKKSGKAEPESEAVVKTEAVKAEKQKKSGKADEEELDMLDLGDTRNLTLVDAEGYLSKEVAEVDEDEYLSLEESDSDRTVRKTHGKHKRRRYTEDEYEEADEETDERSAIMAFICAVMAAVGLGAFFASRKKN